MQKKSHSKGMKKSMHPFLKERVRPKNFYWEVSFALHFPVFILSFSFWGAFFCFV